jgi:phosphoglycerate dehydrogenase-like enzyme
MKVIFTYDYGKEKMAKVEALGIEISYAIESNHTDKSGQDFDKADPEAEALICYNPFDTFDFDAFKKLKWIQLSSIGVDQVPVEEVTSRGITVTNNRGGYSIPMGEWIVYKMLSSYKMSRQLEAQHRLKKWKMNTHLLELTGKRALFIGTGTISQEAVKRLVGFDLTLVGINTTGHPVAGFHETKPMASLKTELERADFVIIAIPHTDKTTHLINQEMLSAMKTDAVIINVARGAIIDEDALVATLETGKFLSVALDVFENEPLPAEHPLWDFEQVSVSPHNSWISEYRNERRFDIIYNNLKAFKEGKELKNVVNFAKGY